MSEPTKILYIDNYKVFSSWGSKTYEIKYQAIKEANNIFRVVDMDDEDLGSVKPDEYRATIFGWNAIPISKYYNPPKHDFYKEHYIPTLEKPHQILAKTQHFLLCSSKPKYLVVQDLHKEDYHGGLANLVSFLKRFGFTGIVTPYLSNDNIRFIQNKLPKLIVRHLPHHIDRTVFKDYGKEKTHDILLFGNDHKKFYPFRHRVIRLLMSDSNKDKFNIFHIPKPRGYFKDTPISGEKLSKIMNRCWLTLCTPSQYDYLLGKYFETCMSKSVVLGNMATDGKILWENNYVKIEESMTDEEIINEVTRALENKEELIKIADEMAVKMKPYDIPHYATDLWDLI